MKNLIAILFLTVLALNVHGQNASPRYVAYGANSASSISFGQHIVHDTAGAAIDSVQVYPRYQQTNITLTVKDSCILNTKSIAGCYQNDRMYLYIVNPAQTGVVKFGANFKLLSGTSISLTANKHCTVYLWFDGINWIELSQNINY